VNELLFLDRCVGLLGRRGLRVLDIGAGYGRLAWRMIQSVPEVADYCCVDAIAESTFLCDYYLRYRGVAPPARVVPLDQAGTALREAQFDLVVNVHSFSECTIAAIAGWCEHIARLRAPYLFVVPNEGEQFLSLEPDRTRRDFRPLIEQAGYELVHSEPVIEDDAVRELVGVFDHFHLFKLRADA
jgi:SAM-dependent methyltransferase